MPGVDQSYGSAAKNARDAKCSLIPDRGAIIKRYLPTISHGRGTQLIAHSLERREGSDLGRRQGYKAGAHWHRSYVNKILTKSRRGWACSSLRRGVPTKADNFAACLSRHPRLLPVRRYQEMFDRVQTLIKARPATVYSREAASYRRGPCPVP